MSSRFVTPIRLRNLIWIAVLVSMWAAVSGWGTPHLRIAYSYTGSYQNPFYRHCKYWGLSRVSIKPADGQCPLVAWIRRRSA